MNRRHFIQISALASTSLALAGLSSFAPPKLSSKVKIFVLRGVKKEDILEAIKSVESKELKNIPFVIQIGNTQTNSYTHANGFHELVTGIVPPKKVIRTELLDQYQIENIVESSFTNKIKHQLIYFHHTEIAHSSKKIYQQNLEKLITSVWKNINPNKNQLIITTDIGRNNKLNSMGGMDHSNPSCLETFALYLGKNASKIKTTSTPILHSQLLNVRF